MSVSYDDQRVWLNIHQDLKDELLLRTVSLLECLICSEVMHVPYLAICGHSFCYGCLDAWFETKLNCPTCRQDMEEPPILNIQLREVSKAVTDLVIDTLEDEKHKKELLDARLRLVAEYDQAAKTKHLFREAFNSAPTLVDRSDGVPRCGNCHWEAHGSVCLHCGARFRIPRGDLYFDSEDGDAYNEDEEEVEMYGVDHANYDSEDSFVDTRDEREINNDREQHDSDGLLSSGEDHSDAELWDGFRRDAEMYRAHDDQDTDFTHTINLDAGLFTDLDIENGRNEDRPRTIAVDLERELGSEADTDFQDYPPVPVYLPLGLDLVYEDTHHAGPRGNGELSDSMEHAVEQLHDQDVEDYSTHYEPDFEAGSDSDWGTSVAMGSRPQIVYLDSE